MVCPKAPMMARSPDLFGGGATGCCTLDGKKAMNIVYSNSFMLIYTKKDAMYIIYISPHCN